MRAARFVLVALACVSAAAAAAAAATGALHTGCVVRVSAMTTGRTTMECRTRYGCVCFFVTVIATLRHIGCVTAVAAAVARLVLLLPYIRRMSLLLLLLPPP